LDEDEYNRKQEELLKAQRDIAEKSERPKPPKELPQDFIDRVKEHKFLPLSEEEQAAVGILTQEGEAPSPIVGEPLIGSQTNY